MAPTSISLGRNEILTIAREQACKDRAELMLRREKLQRNAEASIYHSHSCELRAKAEKVREEIEDQTAYIDAIDEELAEPVVVVLTPGQMEGQDDVAAWAEEQAA